MKWASAISMDQDIRQAIVACADAIRRDLQGSAPDLTLLFVSPHFRSHYPRIAALVQEHLPSRFVIGCSAQGVIGSGHEIEDAPAISLTSAVLPGVDIRAIHSDGTNLPDEDAPPEAWSTLFGMTRLEPFTHFVILADPFSTNAEDLLAGLDYAFPSGAKIGGLASGAQHARENALFLQDRIHASGLVAVALSGNIAVDTIVAQGCRPIGKPASITRCQQNMLVEIDAQPPLQYIDEMARSLSEYDRKLMRTALFIGLAMDPFRESYQRGDFLIRNLIGVDYNSGALLVGALLQEGQVVQFHLRDKITSAEDLSFMLKEYKKQSDVTRACGALLFSCLGRGRYLYGAPDHDTALFQNDVGPVALGGFFCNGEIGPVGPSTYVHGYTSSFGIFRPVGQEAV